MSAVEANAAAAPASDLTTAATTAPDPLCAVVVVHYRNSRDTLACVHSVLAHGGPVAVVLVDNASPDGSGEQLAAAFADHERVTVVRSEHNGGFGAGCNRGIDAALARWPGLQHVLLLNPDARLRAGSLQAMRSCAQRHPRAGIVGCRVVDDEGGTWFANGRFPAWTLSRFHTAPPGGTTEFEADFVTGCCMLLDAQMLQKGVRFDERFFLYGEDADLCRTVQARGRSLYVTHAGTVEHQGGGSQPGKPVLDELSAERLYWLTRAKVMLARKHLPPPQRWTFYGVALVVKPTVALLTGRGVRWIGPYFRGLMRGLFG